MIKLSRFKRLFSRLYRRDDGTPVTEFWVTGKEDAALIRPESGRVLAYVCHDGCGKYYPVVIVSPWRAFRLITRELSSLRSLRAFPRLGVELFRFKTESLDEAKRGIEYYLDIDR